MAATRLKFQLLPTYPQATYRLGNLVINRASASVELPSPNFITTTSRGVIPHLSRDHVRKTDAINWVHIPFETFLEYSPPVPTLQPGNDSLHTFLGFPPNRYIVSLSLRDHADTQHVPPNTDQYVIVQCLRGSKQVTPSAYQSYVSKLQPDIVFSIPDIPSTPAPHSQRRVTKTIERTVKWLMVLLAGSSDPSQPPPGNVFVHLLGGSNTRARAAFTSTLSEHLESAVLQHVKTIDDAVSGYVLDLRPIRSSVPPSSPPLTWADESALLKTSLSSLPPTKLRLLTETSGPHEILHHILHTGIDFFDSGWAQRAADWGVALTFKFPASGEEEPKAEIGTNLYEDRYAMDFSSLLGHAIDSDRTPECACIACSPSFSSSPLFTDASSTTSSKEPGKPFSRSYIHHLLHTHEMSSHALLASHNLTVLSTFFSSIRSHLAHSADTFEKEVKRFGEVYDYDGWGVLMERGRERWEEVDLARGKGRLKREKMKSKEQLGGMEEVILDGAAVGRKVELSSVDVDVL